MPDRDGRIRGITVPRVPWHRAKKKVETPDDNKSAPTREQHVRGGKSVEIDGPPARETR